MNELDDLIVCPVCHGTLDGALECAGCGRAYERRQGAPDLTPDPPPDAEVLARWDLWEALQANGEHMYTAEPDVHLSVSRRADADRFAEFCGLSGAVLDVGCGPQAMPSYGLGFDGRFVGLDPLLGVQPRRFGFVKGIAEYLPFRDGTFDHVLFATSLDHVLSPRLSLREARRVVKPEGAVGIWFGDVDTEPPPATLGQRAALAASLVRSGQAGAVARRAVDLLLRRPAPHAPAATLATPEGAVDPFHFAHLDRAGVERWLAEAGLAIDEIANPLGNHWFVRARRA